jgi:hypothetical protein
MTWRSVKTVGVSLCSLARSKGAMPMTRYRWNSVTDTLLSEQDEIGNTIATYAHDPVHFGELLFQRRDDHTYYHYYDGLGNAV